MAADDRVVFVTVTYGKRMRLVLGAVAAAFDAGAGHGVVVLNGCSDEVYDVVTAGLDEYPDSRTTIIRLERNLGSAGGYHHGMKAARRVDGVERIWLLDDDNWALAGSLSEALAAETALDDQFPGGVVATVCLRPYLGLHHRLSAGESVERVYPRPGSALGFDARSRMPGRRQRFSGPVSTPIEVPLAPFGGLLVRTELIDRTDLPRLDYVLYTDDYEYVDRLRSVGVRVFLVPRAELRDVDSPQRGGPGAERGLVRLLRTTAKDHVKLYYQLRNDAHLDLRRARADPISKLWFVLNLSVYLSAVVLFAVRARANRVAVPVVMTAVVDGLRGRLGARYEL